MLDLNEVKEELRSDPNNPRALRKVAWHYLDSGQYRMAKDYYAQALRACPHVYADILLDYEREIKKDFNKIGPRLSLAGFYFARGDIDAALLEMEEALESDPKSVEAYNLLGKIYVKQERLDDAITLLEQSLQEGVKDVALIEILAGAYMEKGRTEDAIKFYEEILTVKIGDKQILRVLGDLYTRIEDYVLAAKRYQAMFSNDPEVSREVITKLEGLLKKLEGNVYIREVLADIYVRSLNPEAAVIKLEEVIRLDSDKRPEIIAKFKAILKNYPGHPEVALALASAQRSQSNFSEAVEAYHDLFKTRPEFIDQAIKGYQEVLAFCPDQILARTYLAEAFLYKNQVREALAEFENMLRVDAGTAEIVVNKCRDIVKSQPQLFQANVVLGKAYLAKGELQKAVQEAQSIIALDKRYTSAYLLLGEAYFQLKSCRKAMEVLKQVLTMDPYNLEVQEKYCQVKELELEREIKECKEKLITDQWKVSLHLDLAKMFILKDLREEAVRELQLALKDQARAPFACNLLGSIHRREGRYDLAAAQFNRALELSSAEIADFARTVKLNLGTTLEAQGHVSKALKVYESILQEDIDFGDLRQKVKYLKVTSLNSIRNKALLMVVSRSDQGEIIALWGREAKAGRKGGKEDVNISFGQKYNLSGWEYFMKGMYKAALEEFGLAVQLDSKFPVSLNNLAVSLAKEGRFSEARLKLEEAVHLDSNSVVLHNNLGVVYFLLGQIEKANQELQKAKVIDPELEAVCINLGDVTYLQKKVEEALKLYKKIGSFGVLSDLAEQRLRYKVPD
ncbi:hypothetical protein A2291_02320 [candidate division WOR-1 bacterium RIFOXYB2_FULL_42_35]|uniref:Uncharacterized protein n=1 Tax=candidate division WOR-1 bacterium RIFOXYC2_FULL_41_25 TaxID=1802586 RepID=A0A1F4TRB3_UNCSA|nr:MAG: hypothetical protein A2247_07245 [candidate division WOR-1 bacterium RIFOXYA2_FULL_41_14]OGC25398.1 MAG: hypothetical protein A2291_02320 [candidate division WOR-1 bacterium RIFOXYB2_FULL_42_35]OGC35198.1 MAG: hypothetical protein A2462_07555 [candidate division WOR-1 bacterium RIFOXYC2_FULL_41_25]OGC42986.1 MAG: hypothetical protein A2548_04810 [candidate division WOR-1 bacterium RIFOXYD2_FULL_41_8]